MFCIPEVDAECESMVSSEGVCLCLLFPLSSTSGLALVALKVSTCARNAIVVHPHANLIKTLLSKLRRSAKIVAGNLAESTRLSRRGVDDVSVAEEAALGARVPPAAIEPEFDSMTLYMCVECINEYIVPDMTIVESRPM